MKPILSADHGNLTDPELAYLQPKYLYYAIQLWAKLFKREKEISRKIERDRGIYFWEQEFGHKRFVEEWFASRIYLANGVHYEFFYTQPSTHPLIHTPPTLSLSLLIMMLSDWFSLSLFFPQHDGGSLFSLVYPHHSLLTSRFYLNPLIYCIKIVIH